LSVTVLLACQPEAEIAAKAPSGASADATESFENRLYILTWPGYIERGESDQAFDWVTSFEQDTGCELHSTTASSSEEMIALIQQGGHDLVTAAGDASLRLIRSGLVQPIDLERIPSYANVDARLRDAPWHFVDGRHYGTPFLWTRNVIAYDSTVFERPPRTWSILFEPAVLPDGRSNRERIQAYGGPMSIADAALYLRLRNADLGITDPYELNEAQYTAALGLLRNQRKLVQRYWRNVGEQAQGFTTGGVVASIAWPYTANRLAAAGRPIGTTVPNAVTTGRADTTLLTTGARHPVCAYRWMEWSLNATVQGDAAAWTGAVPSVPAACDDNERLGVSGCRHNGADDFETTWFWRTPTRDCAQGSCVPYERWVNDYGALISDQ
jgi:putative spermidine/putrescine transport system substrate-binding protein